MLLQENFPLLKDWNISILGSDISEDMLERCRKGVYSQLEVNRGLPASYLIKYFDKSGADWKIKDTIRNRVTVQNINLIGLWPVLSKMDIILLRNVLIYFNVETKKTILAKVRQVLKPDGYFFLGGSETTIGVDDAFERVQFERSAYYRLKGGL